MKSYLGVDLGTSSIKIVELKEEKGRPKLVTYGFSEQTIDVVKSDSKEVQSVIVQAVKAITKKSRMTTGKTIAALPSFAVFSSIISLPFMSKKDLVSAVRWEAKKFIPLPLEEMVLDWKVLSNEKKAVTPSVSEKQERNYRILLTAAPKNLVKRYIEIFRDADLELTSLETEAFAIERSLIGRDPASIVVVDIGAIATDISVIVDGIPILNRSIDIGGNTITKSIANSLNIEIDRAEQFKRDVGLAANPATPTGQGQIPRTIEFILGSVVNEIKYVLNLYQSQGEKKIEKIILAGGSSFLPNIIGYLEKILDLRVFIGNPWARVIYPVELKDTLEELGPRFAVAVGLAMREIV